MVIKESSDELNPPKAADDVALSTPRSVRSATDYLALAIATCGVGYLPLAPGTWGSLLGVGIYLLSQLLRGKLFFAFGDGHWIPFWVDSLWKALTLALVFFVTFAGVWAATRVERLSGKKDPGIVVIPLSPIFYRWIGL